MSDDEKLMTIPFVVHEYDMEREERKHKRSFIIILVLITYSFLMTAVCIASNYYWIEYEKSFVDTVTTTQTVTQDSGDGGTNSFKGDFIGGDYYGETDSYNDSDQETN